MSVFQQKVRHPIPHIKHPAETMMDAGDIRETMGDHAQRGTTGFFFILRGRDGINS